MMPSYKKTMTVFGAVVLAVGLSACGSSSDKVEEPAPEPMPPPPTEQEVDQQAAAAAAATAAAAAQASATAAAASSDAAMAATANLATLQTNGMAGMSAAAAKAAADMAMAESAKASAASDAAAAATLGSVAGAERAKAEAAQMAAAMYAETAAEQSGMAVEQAMMELMIDGKTKSVGDSSLTISDGDPTITTGAGTAASPRMIVGGMRGMFPTRDGAAVMAGVGNFVDSGTANTLGDPGHSSPGRVDDANTPMSEAKAYSQAVAARTGDNALKLGVVYDSADDMARLMLIHSYAGTEMAYTYQQVASPTAGTSMKAGHITVTDSTGAPQAGPAVAGTSTEVPLTLVGEFYRAGDDTTPGTELVHSLVVADDAKPLKVYSYTVDVSNVATTFYVVEASTDTVSATGDTTYSYNPVDIDVVYLHPTDDGNDSVTTALAGDDRMRRGTAAIPKAMEYEHIHFGIWAGLGDAANSGAQDIADLGIGFVQNHSGGGMTADMPNHGSATFMGDWAGTVMSSGGLIVLDNGGASLTADFDKATVTASLTGLARLTGALDGSTFAGTAASRIAHDNLNPNASFAGEFSGGFYGAGATEAGGVFDFAETGGGAFRGAFGGQRKLTP